MMKEGCKRRDGADKGSDANFLGGVAEKKKRDEEDRSRVKLYKKGKVRSRD